MWLDVERSKLSHLGLLRGAFILVLTPRDCTIDDISASVTPARWGVSMMTIMGFSKVFKKPILVTDTSMLSRGLEDSRLNRCLLMSSKAARFANLYQNCSFTSPSWCQLIPLSISLIGSKKERKHVMGRGAFLWNRS
ncbi:hypothetical protein ACFX1W_013365 [Malus domestica]